MRRDQHQDQQQSEPVSVTMLDDNEAQRLAIWIDQRIDSKLDELTSMLITKFAEQAVELARVKEEFARERVVQILQMKALRKKVHGDDEEDGEF